MNKAALLFALVLASFSFVSCGGGPTQQTTRVLASQSVASPTANPGLIVVNGTTDTLSGQVSAGNAPGLMAMSPNRATLLVLDTSNNKVEVITTAKVSLSGGIQLPGPTTSMVALSSGFGYAAVPTAALNGNPPGALIVMNLSSGGVASTVSIPGAQTVVSSGDGSQLLVFSNDTDVITIVSPLLVNTGSQVTSTVTACTGCRPTNAVFRDRKSTRLNSSHGGISRMPSSA